MPKRRTSDKQYNDISQTINIIKLRDSIKVDFQNFNDPRLAERSLYPSWYLFLVIISGYLSGCNTLEDIAHFAYLRKEWLSSLNDKNLGAPSYDTLWWFLARTEPKAFKELLSRWLSKIPLDFRDKLLMIDGKRLRGVSDNEHINHIVELFAAERCIVIAQEKVPEKRDERQASKGPITKAGKERSNKAAFRHGIYTKQAKAHHRDMMALIRRSTNLLEGF